MKNSVVRLALMCGLALALAGVLYAALHDRAAPVPPAFANGRTLQQARDAAATSGRPVLALAVAEWCPYCQRIKRDALTDPRVASWIASESEAAYIDVSDKLRDPAVQELTSELHVSEVPVLLLLDDGREIARLAGAFDADEVLAWLRSRGAVAPTREARRGRLPAG